MDGCHGQCVELSIGTGTIGYEPLLLTPTKFVKIGVLPLFSMELWVILYNFCSILIRRLTSNRLYLVWKGPRGPYF